MAKGITLDEVAAESPEQRRARASTILRRLRTRYEPVCGLRHESPFQLLIATILSAQSTDEQVNKVTPELFARYPDPAAFAAAGLPDIEAAINRIGLFRNKAKSVHACCRMLLEEFGGEVPDTMAELDRLPGVARKTANVVLGTAFGKASGVVVDTHVQRLAWRLGLSDEPENPVKIERELMAVLPKNRWIEAGHNLVWHGRKCCFARKPQCSECVAADLCPKRDVTDGV